MANQQSTSDIAPIVTRSELVELFNDDFSKERFNMSSIGLLSLICALTLGVFGFGAETPLVWTWEKVSFFIFLLLAMACFVGSTMRRPSLFWEVLDEVRGKRFQKRRQSQARALIGDQLD
jgi:hypothetical protein